MGVGIGLFLSKMVNITSMSNLFPVFLVLSVLNIYTSYVSAKVIDEAHLNN